MWHSLERQGQLQHFDFYILSDSNQPDRWVEEEAAWISLCLKLNAFGKIFYRKRRQSINGKSGNVADFCRRWGKRYRYMIVLDADSIMTGQIMVRLTRAMEANPQIGILQTVPHNVLGKSLFRRIFQFSGRLSSGLFSQGVSFAQFSSGSYWGHNAIIRIAPFVLFCDLPELPVPDPKRRHILSHDTVEAALMQKAGYEVWLAYEELGSYEEGPPSLTDMLVRDRRWCSGNLQHFWFLFARGITLGSRIHIYMGLMAYLSSPLWLIDVIATSIAAYYHMLFLVVAGPEEMASISNGPRIELMILTITILFAPRLLGLLTNLPKAMSFGNPFGLVISTILDTLISIIMAPVFMAFHSIFVILITLGLQIKWNTQNRSDSGLTFWSCLQTYGWLSVLGALGLYAALDFLQANGWWLAPIFLGWILAPFMAWFTSQELPGRWARALNLFVTPEESHPPAEIQGLSENESTGNYPLWTDVLINPYIHALHLSILRQRSASSEAETPSSELMAMGEKLLSQGGGCLSTKDVLKLLWDADTLTWLHEELWSRPDEKLHPSWLRQQADSHRSPLLPYLLQDVELFSESLTRVKTAAVLTDGAEWS
jgi:membrane glycosyltransferase